MSPLQTWRFMKYRWETFLQCLFRDMQVICGCSRQAFKSPNYLGIFCDWEYLNLTCSNDLQVVSRCLLGWESALERAMIYTRKWLRVVSSSWVTSRCDWPSFCGGNSLISTHHPSCGTLFQVLNVDTIIILNWMQADCWDWKSICEILGLLVSLNCASREQC